MIIEKIELENFQCYSGRNVLEFKEGINVIIGDNGYGKSKLYDAFYWVLYDKIFVPERKQFESTKIVKASIISDKAKADIQDGRLVASVALTFHNLDNDKVYILERRYTVTVKEGQIVESSDSEFTVMQKELAYLNAKMVTDEEEKQSIVKRILPDQLKDYLWFQGEQVESIIDFNKHDSLTKAINVLSSIKRYDELKSIADAAAKSANNEYEREVKRLSKDADKTNLLEKDKDKVERELSNLQEDESQVSENLSRAEARCDELLDKQADANKVKELQERKKGVVTLLQELNENLKSEQAGFSRKLFRSKWILKGTEFLHDEFSERFSKYERNKLERIAEIQATLRLENETNQALQTRLPFNVPEPNYVQWMLKQERCLVCDRAAIKDSVEWRAIETLLKRPDKPKTDDIDKQSQQDFSEDFKRLYQNGIALKNHIPEIDNEVNEALNRRSQLTAKVRDANNSLQKTENDIQKLLSDTSLTADGANNLLNEYSIQNRKARDFKDQLNGIVQKIDHLKASLRQINDQLEALVTGEIPGWLIEKREILNDFSTIASSTRDRVFGSLINQLELEANKHYEAMTSGNRSIRGRIKLRKLPNGNYMPEIVDDKGNPLLGSNTSNLILVKLSAIMAIISAKSSTGEILLYTLITDAPTSVFGEDYTIGFCKTISRVYKQSIIMSKEFYRNEALKAELLTSPEIKRGNVYVITPSVTEKERVNRNSLSTTITPL